ncbi:hypothetical protein [Bacteroides thetaiotaomicron]|jgi:predicted  nucleic acid-binding Zn-ribbon protein|uniref:hypothetical protein n=1 Tax=Bacteroides thetaiotaomicron TaxID=818 RepID=UPI002055A6E7|nr:hypothetical protein [Bacteroides thetaiotaomicron]MDC2179169.1 hypothetical protein [Bacteroides thetaiotaomicron]DAE79222.1 MAG TPA: Tape measure domain protein [Bacteriophage sp.]
MAGLNFDITANNSDFLKKTEEIKKGIREAARIIEEEGKRLEGFDSEVLKMCTNLNKYFDSLLDKIEVMSSMLQFGKVELSAPSVKSDGVSVQQLDEFRSKNAELTAQLEKQKEEIRTQQEEWNKLATAIKSNNVTAIEQYKQATNSSSDSVKKAKVELKDLTKDLNENIKYYDKLASQIASYKSILDRLYTAKDKGLTRVQIGDGATALISSELERFKPQLDDVIQKSKEIASQISEQRKRQTELNTVIEQGNEKHLRTRTLIMDAREQLIQMRASGMQNTIQYQQAGEELGKMRLQMKLVNAEMEFLANPNKGLATLKAGLSGAATSASLVVGVMGLFNDKSEKMAELQTKIQSLMGIVVGLEGTYGMLKKSNTVMLAIENVRRKAIIASMALENKAKTTNIALTWSEVAAQKAFNLAAKANPYVLLATAILSVVGGIYLLVKANKEGAKAQEEANKKIEAAKAMQESYMQSFSSIASAQMATYQKLKKEYDSLGNSLKNKKKFILENQESFHQLGLAVNCVSDAENIFINQSNAVTNAIMQRAKAAAIGKIAQEKWEEYFKERENSIALQSGLSAMSSKVEYVDGMPTRKLSFDKNKSDSLKQSLEKSIDGDEKIKALKNGAEKWSELQIEVEKSINEVLKQAGIDIFNNNTFKQENAADKLRKEQEKYNLLLDQQKREAARMKTDSQHELEQIEIDGLVEGSEKVLRQRKLNHDKEIEEIKREAEDKKLKEIEKARSAFEANPANAKKTFDTDKFVKSEPVKKQFASFDKTAEAKTKAENTNYNRGDDLKGLLDEYQDYTDKRLAIERKFNEDIATLQEQRKQAVKNGDTEQMGQIDRSIAKATSDKGKELMKHDFDVLKQSPEYIRAFEDLRNTSSETLNSLLKQLENAKQTAAQTLNPEDLRGYTTTIQEIMDELDARNPFQSLVDRQAELAEAEKELAEAKRSLDKVNSGEKVVSGTKLNTKTGKIDTTYLSAAEALKRYNAAKDKSQKANNNFVKAEKTAKEKVDELANAVKGIGNSIGGTSGEIISLIGDVALFTTGTIDGITKVAKTGADAMSAVEKASVILGIISAGIQLMQQLNSILPTADNQYEKFAEKVAEINKLTDAVNEYRIAALEAQQAEANWFSEDNLNNLRDYKELHDEVAEAYKNKAEESQATYQNKSGGGWFINSWNWFLDNTYGKIWGVDFARKYKEGQTAAVDNLRIETRSRKKGFLGSGIGGRSQETEDLVSWARSNGFGELFDNEGLINKEAANAILNQYGDKLVGQTKETLESLVELREKYDEYLEQLHEYVSSLYEPLVDNFVDSIWDWLDSGKDALASFKEYASDTFRDIANDMLKSIVLSKIFGEGENSYQSKINKAYDDYAKGLIDEVELNRQVSKLTADLMKNAEEQLPAIQGMAENISNTIKDTAGIDITQSESASQSSSQKGFAAMSQDTGEELNGRFTALQISNEEIKNSMLSMLVSMNLISVTVGNNSITLTEIRNLAISSNSYLEDIAGYQKRIINEFGNKLDSINSGIKQFNSK